MTHYLKAVDALGSDEAKAVIANTRDLPIQDLFAITANRVSTGGWCTTCTSSR